MCFFITTKKVCNKCLKLRSTETTLDECPEVLQGKGCRGVSDVTAQVSLGACRACFQAYVIRQVAELELAASATPSLL